MKRKHRTKQIANKIKRDKAWENIKTQTELEMCSLFYIWIFCTIFRSFFPECNAFLFRLLLKYLFSFENRIRCVFFTFRCGLVMVHGCSCIGSRQEIKWNKDIQGQWWWYLLSFIDPWHLKRRQCQAKQRKKTE